MPFGPDLAAVPPDHPPHRGQSHPVARELLLAMQALERAEQLGRVLLAESGTVVAHEADRVVPRVRLAAHLDPRARRARGEFPGVANQVLQQVADKVWIAACAQAG